MNCRNYPQVDERAYRETLSNGLDVIIVPRQGFSRKIAYFVTDFGAIHTEFTFEGKHHHVPAGVAHFLEHKLFDMPEGRDVTAEFAAYGAHTNAFTSYDMTAYYFSCTENFDKCLRTLVEFVSTPYFTEESVQKELGIIDQEIGMTEDTPDNCVYENLVSAAFSSHPIRVPILGSRESIREITPEILHTCHRAFYTPGNMLLCVVGDVDPEQVKSIALEVLGDQPREVAEKIRSWQEPENCENQPESGRMEVAMPMFSLLFKGPAVPHGEAGFRLETVADLAAEILFGESSELYLKLYEEGIIDSSFGGGFECLDGCSMMMISGDSDDPEAIREAVIAQAEKIVAEGIRQEDFLRTRRSVFGSRVKALDSFDATCFRLSAYHMTGFDYFDFPRVHAQVEPGEVLDFLKGLIRRDNCALSVIYPTQEENE